MIFIVRDIRASNCENEELQNYSPSHANILHRDYIKEKMLTINNAQHFCTTTYHHEHMHLTTNSNDTSKARKLKPAFHDSDTDILARILARKSRVSDVRKDVGVSGESVSWNAALLH